MVLMPLKPYIAEENEEMTSIEYIRKGMAELPVRIQMGGALKPLTHILQSWIGYMARRQSSRIASRPLLDGATW